MRDVQILANSKIQMQPPLPHTVEYIPKVKIEFEIPVFSFEHEMLHCVQWQLPLALEWLVSRSRMLKRLFWYWHDLLMASDEWSAAATAFLNSSWQGLAQIQPPTQMMNGLIPTGLGLTLCSRETKPFILGLLYCALRRRPRLLLKQDCLADS